MVKRLSPIIAVLVLCGQAGAATLLNYESRVVRAAEQLKRIKTDEAYADEGIATIRTLVPASEQIDVLTRTVAIDNAWLYDLIDAYEASADPQLRKAYLEEAEGRLRALDAHLLASGLFVPSQRERWSAFEDLLDGKRAPPKQESRIGAFIREAWQSVTGLIKELVSALNRLLSNLFGTGSGGSWFVRILVLAMLGAALFMLARTLRKRAPRRKRRARRMVLGEEVEANATPRDLANSAMEAAARGDYRRAMRGLYIALLFDMTERRLIELDESATNREYLARVSRFQALAAPMRYLTERFDYFWYGMFPSTEADFSSYLARYKEAAAQVEVLGRQAA